MPSSLSLRAAVFLSTPSARRATLQCLVTWSSHRYFYPRPPRGGRRTTSGFKSTTSLISIHALREEGDVMRFNNDTGIFDFYPRPPRGGRRTPPDGCQLAVPISIHALREEGDGGVHAGR